jgi:hypothetical protein
MWRNDAELLHSLERKRQLIRDRTRGVAEGYATGFYLWGEGGTSKSYTVEQTLQALRKPYQLSNSRVTGKGLFGLLRDHPDLVHVLEDVETLFADKHSFGVLRSALWGQAGEDGQQERLVVWQTARMREEFLFEGGIILVANGPPDDVPQLRAVKTRITCLRFQPTTEEVAALMRDIARRGHRHGLHRLSPKECLEVATEIVTRTQRLQRNLDLRLLVNALQDRLQWANGSSETHWLDLLESRMKERVVSPGAGVRPRSERRARELAVARRIAGLPLEERMRTWERETGRSRASLYRRLGELNDDGSQISNSQTGEN